MKGLGEEGSPGDLTSLALGTRVLKGNKQMPGLGWSDRGVPATCGASAAINEPALPPPLSGIQPPCTPFSNTSKPVLADLKQAGFLAREVVAFSCRVLGGCWNNILASSVTRTLVTRSGGPG